MGLLAGCEQEVGHYRVEKEPPVETASPPAASAGFLFTAPAGWRPKPAGTMRQASFVVSGEGGAEVDISVTSFPGDTGGLLANVNRWRGQIGLAPIDEPGLGAITEQRSFGGKEFVVVHCAGNGQRFLAAIHPRGGATWFFKMMGDDHLTAAQMPVFLQFLDSVRFE